MLPVVLLAVVPALAYETDQLTGRGAPLADAREVANARADEMLARAVSRLNQETKCKVRPPALQRRLASAIVREMSKADYVEERSGWAGLGFGAYAAWLEEAPEVERRDFRDEPSIYGAVRPSDSLILGVVGVCSTINLAGVLVGTDKVDHFWAQGYTYFVQSRHGRSDARARRWGRESERLGFGMFTTDAFSFADLFANWQGYRYYRSLLEEGGGFRQREDGCVEQARPFDWADWVGDAMDEVIEPPVYGRVVGERIGEWLTQHRDEVCAGYEVWGPDLARRRSAVLAARVAWVDERSAEARDPYGLEALCGGRTAGR